MTRTEAAEKRALERETAEILAAGGVFRTSQPACRPYVELPPPKQWLACWKKVFGLTKGGK